MSLGVLIMRYRILIGALVLLAGYFAFGDFFQASVLSSPDSFVADVGRGIGGAITGIATGVGNFIWG